MEPLASGRRVQGQGGSETRISPGTVPLRKLDPKPPETIPVNPPSSSFTNLRSVRIDMKTVLKWVLSRIKEGSTWAGLGIIAAALGLPNDVVTAGWDVLAAAAGLAAILLKDKPDATPKPD
jgi:hypothetical protein